MNETVIALKKVHQPGKPLILTYVYDILPARAFAELPSCKALATASYSVARAAGTEDDFMTMETNLAAVKGIAAVKGTAAVAKEFNNPLTVDIQDAYGPRFKETIGKLVDLGAASKGVVDFVINARCDVLAQGGDVKEVIPRGTAYLAVGAASVFVWGGFQRGVSKKEVEEMVKAFEGKLNVGLKLGGLTILELAKIGVAWFNVGPSIQFKAMEVYAKEAQKLLTALD